MKQWVDFIESKTSEYPEDSVEIVSTEYIEASSELEQIRNAFKQVTEDVWRMKLTKEKQRE